MSIIRVPSITSKVLVRLNEVMDKLEDNEQDSIEVIMSALDDIEERLDWFVLIKIYQTIRYYTVRPYESFIRPRQAAHNT